MTLGFQIFLLLRPALCDELIDEIAGLNPADQVCYLAAEKRPVLVLAENMLKELSASGPIVWCQRRWVRLDGSGIVASEG